MKGSIVIDGKQYISASRAAEITRYSQDYIGQLCRAGKVPATMAGRAWFVDLNALLEYKKVSEDNSRQNGRLTIGLAREKKGSPAVRAQAQKSSKYSPKPSLLSPVAWKFTYAADSRPLLPTLNKEVPKQSPAGALYRKELEGPRKHHAPGMYGTRTLSSAFAAFLLLIGSAIAYASIAYPAQTREIALRASDQALKAVVTAGDRLSATSHQASQLTWDDIGGIFHHQASAPQDLSAAAASQPASQAWWQIARTKVVAFLRAFLGLDSVQLAPAKAPTFTYIYNQPQGGSYIGPTIVRQAQPVSGASNSFLENSIAYLDLRVSALEQTGGIDSDFITQLVGRSISNAFRGFSGGGGSVTTVVSGGSGSVTSVDASGGTTGLAFSGGPVTTSGTLTLSGILGVANGGTATSAAPTYGKLLLGNSAGSYDLVATSTLGLGGSSGTVSSVDVSGGTTGLIFGGGPITAAGTITMSGTLGIANGGTGLTAVGASSTIPVSNGSAVVYQKLSPGFFTTPNISQWTNDAGYLTSLTGAASSTLLADNNFWSGQNIFNASTTIGNGAQTGGLTISGGATTTGIAYFAGNVGIGTSSPLSSLTVNGTQLIYSPVSSGTAAALTVQNAIGNTSDLLDAINSSGSNVLSLSNNGTLSGIQTSFNAGSFAASVGSGLLPLKVTVGNNQNIQTWGITGGSTLDVITNSGSLGLGTTSPSQTLSVQGNGLFSGNVSLAGLTATGTVTFSSLGSGLVKSTSGILSVATTGTDYATPAQILAAYPFPLTGNATSTLTQFNGGLTAYASSTIGNGAQGGGLTINGGATTTGNAYFSGQATINSNSSAALAVGQNGSLNPALVVDSSTANSVTGLRIGSRAGSNGLILETISNQTNEPVYLTAKGSSSVIIGNGSANNLLVSNTVTNLASGSFGIATDTPSQKLSVQGGGYISSNLFVGGNITSTSSVASILPYASTTALTVGGTFWGAGLVNCTVGKIVWDNGQFSCGIDATGAGGTGGGTWSTTTSSVAGELVNYPNNSSDIVAIGNLSTTTAKYWFDPNIQVASLAGTVNATGNVNVGGTLTANTLTLSNALGTSYGGTGLTGVGASSTVLMTNGSSLVYQKLSPGNFTTTNISQWTNDANYISSSQLLSAYPFPLTGNATSTLTQFNGGLTAYASSTIGDGTQAGGLVVSGGATTTGSMYVGGNITLVTKNALTIRTPGDISPTTLAYGDLSTGNFFFAGAGNSTMTGGSNIGIGPNNLIFTTTGQDNVGIGTSALDSIVSGSFNTALGSGALNGGNGSNNTAIGFDAVLLAHATGTTAVGQEAGRGVAGTSNANNSLFGYQAGYGLGSGGSNNVFLGYSTGSTTVTGANNIALGYDIALPSTNGSNQLNIGNLIFGTNINGQGRSLSTGNIGIGTTTPQRRLWITNTGSNSQLALEDSTAAANQHIGSIGFSRGGFSFNVMTDLLASTSRMVIDPNGLVGIGTTSPSQTLSVQGNGLFSGNVSLAGLTATGTVTFSSLGSGLVKSTSGILSVATAGTDYATPAQILAAYPFPLTGNATSTLTQFNGGLTAYASSTIGNGTQGGGLTILGGATTTGNINIGSNTKIFQNFQPFITSSTTSAGNLAVGYQSASGLDAAGGRRSTYLGYQAGQFATSSIDNVGIGYQALQNVSSVGLLFTPGSNNTAVGSGALQANTYGSNNTAVGSSALTSNATGTNNVAVGSLSLFTNLGGFSNIALGNSSLEGNTFGNYNIALGGTSLFTNTIGSRNISIGNGSLRFSDFGSDNVAIGDSALLDANTASSTVAIGSMAGFGSGSGYTDQGGVYIGYQSGKSLDNNSDFNTFVGFQSGYNVTTGSNNIIIGTATSSTAIANLTTGSQNILIGNNISLPIGTGNGQLDIGNIIYGTGITSTGSTISGGKIGIGTTTPAKTLSVQGDGLFSGDVSISGLNATGTVKLTSLISASTRCLQVGPDGTVSANPAACGVGSNGNISWATTTSQTPGQNVNFSYDAGYTDAVAIGSNSTTTANFWFDPSTQIGYMSGNLGLGKTLPTEKLDVAGNINISSGSSYKYNGTNIANGITVLADYFFGGSGNLLMTGANNVALGLNALRVNSSGASNIALGTNALNGNDSGSSNLALGVQALFNNVGGSNNVALGENALLANVSGGSNTALGYAAGNASTGSNNLFLGSATGQNLTSGDKNIVIGYNINTPAANSANTLNIGNLIYGKSLDGSGSTLSVGNIGIGTTTPYARLSITGSDVSGGGSSNLFAIANAIDAPLLIFNNTGKLGIGTTSPWRTLSVRGSSDLGNNALAGYFTATTTVASVFPYASTTMLTASNGIGAYASSTIGDGTQAGGLTVSGGATTTGNITLYSPSGASRTISIGPAAVGGAGADLRISAQESIASQGGNLFLTGGGGNSAGNVYIYSGDGTIGPPWIGNVILANDGTNQVGSVGIGTTSPSQILSVQGNGLFSGNVSLAGLTATGTVKFSSLGSGLVKSTSGVLSVATAGTDYATPAQILSAYPFPLTGNATSTLTQFNGGLTAYASSTIGNGAQAGGLTINGGATTTGNAYIAGKLGIGTTSPQYSLDVKLTGSTDRLHLVNTSGSAAFLVNAGGAGSSNITLDSASGGSLSFTNGSTLLSKISGNTVALSLAYYNSGTEGLTLVSSNGFMGVGSSSPSSTFSVQGNGLFSGNVSLAGLTATGTVTFSSLGSGLVKSTSGILSVATAGTDYATPAQILAAYPFPLTGNATSTLTQFNGGLTAYASSTIGNSTQAGGLTISGGATTTGNAYIAGKLGIGTTSPYTNLAVVGNTHISGHASIGNSAFVDQDPFNLGGSKEVLNINETATDLSTGNYSGILNMLTLNPSAAPVSFVTGSDNEVLTDAANARNFGSLTGTFGGVFHLGSGNVTAAAALAGTIQNASAGTMSNAAGVSTGIINNFGGTITDAYGLYTFLENAAGSTVNNGYGVYIASSTNSASTFNNNYGLYIEDHSTVGSTNSYNIYSQGPGKNYFGGNVGIGTTSPYAKLSVVGQVVGAYFTATTSVASTFPYASTTAITAATASTTNLIVSSAGGSGTRCLQVGPDGTVSATASACGSGASNPFAFPFDATTFGSTPANATSTLILFNAGLASLASSTIGNGTQIGGLTISGGATTTGNMYIAGLLGIGTTSPYAQLSVNGLAAFDYFNANGTAGTSTIAGGLNVGNGGLSFDYSTGITSIASLRTNSLNFDTNAGVVSWVDLPIDSTPAVNTVESYTANLNGNPMITVYGQVDTGATIKNAAVGIGSTTPYGFLSVNASTTYPAFVIAQASSGNSGPLLQAFSGTNEVARITGAGFLGLGTTSPWRQLSVYGSSDLGANALAGYFTATTSIASSFPYASTTAITATTASTTNLIVSSAGGSGTRCLQVGPDGTVSANASACGTGSGGTFSWTPTTFGSTPANATSTLIGFNAGLYSLASSTIGDGTQAGGLTISGGATTTGNVYFAGRVALGTTSPLGLLSVNGNGVSGPQFVVGSSTKTDFIVTNGGRVGVGTSQPSSALEVNGDITLTNGTNRTISVGPVTTAPGKDLTVSAGYSSGGSGGNLFLRGGAASTVTGNVYVYSGSLGVPSGNVILGNDGTNSFGSVGVATTSPGSTFAVQGNGLFSGNVSLAGLTATGTVTFSSLGSGLVKSTSGILSVATAGTDYATPAQILAAYPFPLTGNATSTLTQFNGGLTAYASSTIGDGTQAGGLTVNGGATTTGSVLISSNSATALVVGQNGLVNPAFTVDTSTASSATGLKVVSAAGNGGGLNVVVTSSATNERLGLSAKGNGRVDIGSTNQVVMSVQPPSSGTGFALQVGTLTSRNVGVGSTSPSQTLSVQGNGLFSGDVSLAGLTATGTALINTLNLTNALTISNGGTGLASVGASSTVLITNGSAAFWQKLATSQLTNDSNFITLASLSGVSPISYNSNTGQISCPTCNTTNATVSSIATNNGLTGGTITTSGTIGLDLSAIPVNNTLLTWNGSRLAATGTQALTAGYFIATTTTATSTFAGDVSVGSGNTAFVVDYTGNVGIGTSSPRSTLSVTGSACFSGGAGATLNCGTTAGNIYYVAANTGAYDVAERYAVSDQSLMPGDIIALDPANPLQVVRASAGTRPIGIISTNPGVILGGADSKMQGTSSRPIALSGRVPVKVNMEGGAISIGDPISLSSIPGVGRKAGQSGDIIGLALEPFTIASTTADIEVFVNIRQYVDLSQFALAAPSGATSTPTLTSTTTASAPVPDTSAVVFAGLQTLTDRVDALNQKIDGIASSSESTSTPAVSADELASSTATALASSTPFIQAIADAVRSLIQSAGNWVVAQLTAKVVYADRIETQVAAVSKGLEMTDQVTGQIFCVTIKGGDFARSVGPCGESAASILPPTPPTDIPVTQPTVVSPVTPPTTGTSSPETAATSTPPAVATSTAPVTAPLPPVSSPAQPAATSTPPAPEAPVPNAPVVTAPTTPADASPAVSPEPVTPPPVEATATP